MENFFIDSKSYPLTVVFWKRGALRGFLSGGRSAGLSCYPVVDECEGEMDSRGGPIDIVSKTTTGLADLGLGLANRALRRTELITPPRNKEPDRIVLVRARYLRVTVSWAR